MINRGRYVALAAQLAVLATASACASGTSTIGSDPVAEPAPLMVDTSILEAGGEVDASVYSSPVAMAKEEAFAAAGSIVAIRDGFEVLEKGTPSEGYDVRSHTVVVEVRVTDLYKGSPRDLTDGSIFVWLSRGGQQEGVENDDGGPSAVTPISAFEEAIPLGSEVIVIGSPSMPAADQYTEVIDPRRGVSDGGLLLAGVHPQTLTFAAPGGGSTFVGDYSMEEVESQLAARF